MITTTLPYLYSRTSIPVMVSMKLPCYLSGWLLLLLNLDSGVLDTEVIETEAATHEEDEDTEEGEEEDYQG